MKRFLIIVVSLVVVLVSCSTQDKVAAKTHKIFLHEYTEEEREILSLLHSGINTIIYEFEENTQFSRLICSVVNYESDEVILSNSYDVGANGSFALALGLPGDDMMLSIISDGSGRYEFYEDNFVDEYEVSYHTQMAETAILNDDEITLAIIYLREGSFLGVKSKNSSRADIALLLENASREKNYEEIYLVKCKFSE